MLSCSNLQLVVDKEFVPLAVTDDLGVELQTLPTLDEFEQLAKEDEVVEEEDLTEFEVKEEDISKVAIVDVIPEAEAPVAVPDAKSAALASPESQRLTGKWKLYVSDDFKEKVSSSSKELFCVQ